MTREVMVSTTTTARGTMMGSWRPLISQVMSSPERLTVCWAEAMDGVGLMAARKVRRLPSEIPPSMPPAWLVSFSTVPSVVIWKASLLVEPFAAETAKPSPISKPLTAPMEQMALARLALSFSKTGSPRPTGRPSTAHSIIPPTESFCSMQAFK